MTDTIASENASLKEQKGDEASCLEAVNQPNITETNQTDNAAESDESNKEKTEDNNGDKTNNKTQDKDEETNEDKYISSMDETQKPKADGDAGDEEGNSNGEEEADAEYEVEMVVGHKHVKGRIHYLIKWNGYSSDDNSWEDGVDVFCTDLIEAYWRRHEQAGGSKSDLKGIPKKDSARPARSNGTAIASKASKKDRDGDTVMEMAPAKRQRTSALKDALKDAPKDARKSDEVSMNVDLSDIKWTPPKSWTSWEDKVRTIQTVERINQQLLIRLEWKNGRETQHPIELAHQKCPQKLIQFYESHIKFSQA
jgi:chromobox protein 1